MAYWLRIEAATGPAIAEKLIKNARWWRVRRKVRRALEQAHQDGLDAAAAKVIENSSELSESIRGLASDGGRPLAPPPRQELTH